MITKKLFGYGFFAVIISIAFTALSLTGCPTGDNGGDNNDITYTAVQTGGAANTADSTGIVFTFSASIDALNLTADDIEVTGVPATKGITALSGSDKTWTLPITVTSAGNVTVKITKDGIEAKTKTVAVYKASGPTDITYTLEQVGGEDGKTDSTGIQFTFNASVDALSLTVTDITVGGVAEKDAEAALTGSGTTWTLSSITVNNAGLATVQINKDGIEAGQKSVPVYKQGEYLPEYWSITWNLNGGEEGTGAYPEQIVKGAVLDKPSPDPTKTGNTFGGWYSDSGLTTTYNFSSAVTADLNLYAKWVTGGQIDTEITYTLEQTGGTDGTTDSSGIVFTFSASIDDLNLSADDITVTGAAEKSANAALTGTGLTRTLPITVNSAGLATVQINKPGIEAGQKTVLVYKEGQAAPQYWSITWNLNGGVEGAGAYPEQIVKGAVLAKPSPDPTKAGNTFGGWYTNSGLTTAYNFSAAVTANLSLYAKWTPEVQIEPNNDITYTLDQNGGRTDGTAGSTDIMFFFSESIDDLGLTAADITVTGAAEKGTGALTSRGYYWALPITVNAIGLATVQINKPGIEAAQKSVTVFREGFVLITWHLNGGAEGTGAYPTEIARSTALAKPSPDPTKAGNIFGGWYSNVGLTYTYNFSSAVSSPANLYAKWLEIGPDGLAYEQYEYSYQEEIRSEDGMTITVVPRSASAYRVSKGTVTGGAVVIPATYNDLPVMEIATDAFRDCGITGITIGENVTTIGNNAFTGCTGLTNIIIDTDKVANTFTNNWVTRFPADGLSITFKKAIGDNACYFSTANATKITSVTIEAGVTSIGNYAFSGCTGLTGTLNIPAGVTSIGGYAFNGLAGLTGVTIPNSVTSIGGYAFQNCTGLTGVPIGEGVTSIGDSAFSGCTGLTGVITIPNSVTSIGSSAFNGLAGLTGITIGENVTTIGNNAFSGCTSLTNIIIDTDKVSNYQGGNWGTRFPADGLSITFKKDIGSNACSFSAANTTKIASVIIEAGVTSIGDYAFRNCASLTDITIGAGVTTISTTAFNDCTNLKNIIIDTDKVTNNSTTSWLDRFPADGLSVTFKKTPGNYAFYSGGGQSGSKLASVTIEAGITSIGIYAFYGSTGLSSVTIPSSVTTIGSYAFRGCSYLASITIPSGVRTIDTYAFENCTRLASVTIPATVTSIGNYAFNGCTNLLSVTFAGTIATGSFGLTSPFPGDLRAKYIATGGAGGAGAYTRPSSSSNTWTKS